jgi:hypothetical protein
MVMSICSLEPQAAPKAARAVDSICGHHAQCMKQAHAKAEHDAERQSGCHAGVSLASYVLNWTGHARKQQKTT